MKNNCFGAKDLLDTREGKFTIYRIDRLEQDGITSIRELPFSIRVLLEAVLRQLDGKIINEDDVINLAQWSPNLEKPHEVPFIPAKVLLQDFTGVPSVVDLAALRSAMHRLGGDPDQINPKIPVDLVIDHSVQVDQYGSSAAFLFNSERELERNLERYQFLKWGQSAFKNFRVVPPSTGIVHQVNLEYLAKIVQTRFEGGERVAYPDSLVGTDSHTTMINGLGVLGWGVGGIEAEAAMLGQPIYMLTPEVVGFRLIGELPEGSTATDLVLTATQLLRKKDVVGKFVEFYGPGVNQLSLADRATIANMAPEYGATMGYFPVDDVTLTYLKNTGRSPELVDLVDRYTKEQILFRYPDNPDPKFTDRLELDLSNVKPSLAGPKRPQDRIELNEMKKSYQRTLKEEFNKESVEISKKGLDDGSVVIAAITSCTNTSNPSVMIAAGLLAKNAISKGLRVSPYVKTSLAPGSKVVTRYLDALGLIAPLEKLGFHVVGYGCTTCIGNSGPLASDIHHEIEEKELVVAAVLSGNRNFEGRIHPLTKINYLASPPLVVAYALAGSVNIDLTNDPIGYDLSKQPVYLKDIWPDQGEIKDAHETAVTSDLFKVTYESVFEGDDSWKSIKSPDSKMYPWNEESTYIKEPPFFSSISSNLLPLSTIRGARVLAMLDDSVTTDHISPAGAIPADSPAARYLIKNKVQKTDFNSFGSRRGNHEVMMRGTFGNIRLQNRLVPGSQGGITLHHPTGEVMSIFEAAMKYKETNTPLIVIAGKEYGTGSSRDWAAKGTSLLGIKAVIAESYERIHRSNLVGMGVLPLQFLPGENSASLGITGEETFNIVGLDDDPNPGQQIRIIAMDSEGKKKEFESKLRIDTPIEISYYKNGGVLHTVLREIAGLN
jgi:aconitate hydratase